MKNRIITTIVLVCGLAIAGCMSPPVHVESAPAQTAACAEARRIVESWTGEFINTVLTPPPGDYVAWWEDYMRGRIQNLLDTFEAAASQCPALAL